MRMMIFICPVKNCDYNKDGDCEMVDKVGYIKFECRSDDFDVTLSCPWQKITDNRPKFF